MREAPGSSDSSLQAAGFRLQAAGFLIYSKEMHQFFNAISASFAFFVQALKQISRSAAMLFRQNQQLTT
jgi:hypothetical protein